MGENKCEVCGISSFEKRVTFYKKYGMHLCSKHYGQLTRHGKILDSESKTQRDKNEIIYHGDYAEVVIFNQPTGKSYSVLIDVEDVPIISKHKWGLNIQKTRYGYMTVVSSINKKIVKMHRFIIGYAGDLVVDHINRNPLDNRKSNLRIVTPTKNKQNVSPNGVYKRNNGKWCATFQRDNKQYWVGTFESKLAAECARKNAIMEYDAKNSDDLARAFVDANRSGGGS